MKMLLRIFCGLLLALQVNGISGAGLSVEPARQKGASPVVEQSILEDGTPVKLRFSQTVSSADAHVDDRVEFEVLEEVRVSGVLIIAKGGIAWGTVTEAQSKRRMARGGKLEIVMDSVRLVDGQRAALRAVKDAKGGDHTGAMTAGIVATALVLWPAAPLFLFMHGKDISIPKGAEVPTFINGNFPIDMAKFQQATPEATQVFQAGATAAVSITSTPAGAEISIDQTFVGNTPSSISVSGGKHIVSVTKPGFQSWSREIAVSGGAVNLTAELLSGSDITGKQAVVSTVAAIPEKSGALSPEPPKEIQLSGETETKSGWIGVATKDDGTKRVVISKIVEKSAAADAGLQVGDTILELNGLPVKFYKGRSQEKTPLPRPEFFLLHSPLDRARSVLTYRAMCSVVGQGSPVVWIFSTSGFHRFFPTKPVSSETSKAERWSNLATIVLSGTRGP